MVTGHWSLVTTLNPAIMIQLLQTITIPYQIGQILVNLLKLKLNQERKVIYFFLVFIPACLLMYFSVFRGNSCWIIGCDLTSFLAESSTGVDLLDYILYYAVNLLMIVTLASFFLGCLNASIQTKTK